MQCSSCGTENSARVKFCAECGSPMGVPCPDCAFRNPHGASACGGCGRSLDSKLARVAERRQITVFFADIAGSTTLASSLDPEDLQDIYAQYQALCAHSVQHYEGHIAQYLGDGVLAYFGYPAAHEDDAARAVHAGLEILSRIGTLSGGANRPRIRIGIHTGLVVVGDVGTLLHREQLALGEAPNIAARLQSEALPDTMVVSDATLKLLAGQFAVEDLGSRTLKGLSRPMQLFRVLGRSEASSRFQAMKTAQGLTPFVGREREVEAIRVAWEKAASGDGQTLILSGEAGMGKSRLLEAAAQVAAGRLHEVFDAQCSPYQVHSPLSPIVEMIERRLGIEEDMPPARKFDLLEQFVAGRGVKIEEATAALAGLLSIPLMGRYPEIEIPPARRPQWTIQVLAELLVHSVGGSPVLLLIEDLHWADPSTLDLLTEIVSKQANQPVLMVCTTRPGLPLPWLNQPNCVQIRVDSLSREDTRALVARVAGPKLLPLAVLEEVAARTAGNPLFVEAVTRTILESDVLRELDDHFELAAPLKASLIPASLQDSLMGRIDRLGPDRPVAQLAATIGRESSFELLQAVLGNSTESLSHALQHLVELDLVSQTGTPPSSTYTFRHALIQDAAYESLLRKTRQEFHGKIAEALIHRFPDMAETKPELLARHFEGAGRIPEAIAGWMKAGRQAKQRLALRESVAYLQKAIALLEKLPEDDTGRLQSEMQAQLALGQALTATFGWASRELETAFLRAHDLCKRLGNNAGLVQALNGLSASYCLRGNIPQALETAKAVLDMAISLRDPLLEIPARNLISYPAYFLADFINTRELAEGAMKLYTLERERAIVAAFHLPSSFACANILSLSLWFLGYPDQAERMQREAWGIIEALNIPACTTFALGYALNYHYLRRDRATLARVAEQAYTRAADEGFLFWTSQARIYRGWAQADSAEGIAEMKAALESYRLTGTGLMTPQWCLMLAEAQLRAGQAESALATLGKGIRHADEFQEHANEPELHRLRGEIHLLQRNSASAEASLRLAIVIAQAQKAKMVELRAANVLAALLRDHGRTAEACQLLRPLNDWFQEGFETPELRQSRTLMESLGSSARTA